MLLECAHLRDVILMSWRIREQVAIDMPERQISLFPSIARPFFVSEWIVGFDKRNFSDVKWEARQPNIRVVIVKALPPRAAAPEA